METPLKPQEFYDYIRIQIDRISRLNATPEKMAELYSAVEETIEVYWQNRKNFVKMEKSIQKIIEDGQKLDGLIKNMQFEINGIKSNLDRIALAVKRVKSAFLN